MVGQDNMSLPVQLCFSLYAPTHPRVTKDSLYVCVYGYILFNSSVHAADSISSGPESLGTYSVRTFALVAKQPQMRIRTPTYTYPVLANRPLYIPLSALHPEY